MGRVIKFRGKHIHVAPKNEHLDGRWVYGYLGDENYINSPELEGEFLIAQETICQYTGLHDKDGKEIYEGDIISFTHSKYIRDKENGLWGGMGETEEYTRNYAVEFVNTYCTYGLRARNKSIHFKLSQATINTHNAKVIGNIFDNPELLKEDTENANPDN